MNKTEILIVGRDEKRNRHSATLINSNTGWDAVIATDSEDAIEKFHQRDFTVAVLTSSLQDEKIRLRKIFTLQNPGVIIIESLSDGLLINEISEAIDRKTKDSKHSFSFVDDALKNAMLPITVQ